MDTELVKKYAPYIYFDIKEPFFPVKVGYTIFTQSAISPSFSREIKFYSEDIDKVIEYAIYWDFDIQHLFELEHVWVYIDKYGRLFDCEASFHGQYLKELLKDRSNILDETHVKLYSQPGKHAFLPQKEGFELIPDLRTAVYENAGNSGLIVTETGRGRYETSDEINSIVKKYLQGFKFTPSMVFEEYRIPDSLFVPWQKLYEDIPHMIEKKLLEIMEVFCA